MSATTTISDSAPAELQPWGRLRLAERLGAGTFGEVYRAWDTQLEREVALKLLKADMPNADKALAEGRMLARVRHPNVVSVFGAERIDGRVGLWMEFVKGRTLSQILADQGPFGAREATLIGLELSRALAAVHGAGLVHRDVKAHNVMREEGGRILLTDFGAGLRVTDAKSPNGGISGTPLYMAPEAFDGQATTSTDLYSLGVLLFHLVSGRYPIEADTIPALAEAHRFGQRRRLRDLRPDLPEEFIRVIERAIERLPADRFASAGAMEAALARSLGAVDPASSRSSRAPARPLRIAAATVAVAVLGFAAWRVLRTEPLPTAAGPRITPLTSEGAPPAAEPLRVEARLMRRRGADVQAVGTGGSLRVGDQLSLEVSARQSLYLYVVNEDDAGHAYLLFPLPGAHTNPLPAGRVSRLPGIVDGAEREWTVTSAGGRERVLLVASANRLLDLEGDLRDLPRPARGQLAAPLDPAFAARLRGIGGLTGSEPGDGSGRIAHLRQKAQEQGAPQEVWIQVYALDNPRVPEGVR